jgi:hypothetical protein
MALRIGLVPKSVVSFALALHHWAMVDHPRFWFESEPEPQWDPATALEGMADLGGPDPEVLVDGMQDDLVEDEVMPVDVADGYGAGEEPPLELFDDHIDHWGRLDQVGEELRLREAIARTGQAVLDWCQRQLLKRAADAIAPGAGIVVEGVIKVWEVLKSAQAIMSDRPAVVVPLAELIPGVQLEVCVPLDRRVAGGRSEVAWFLAPDAPSLTAGWAMEVRPEGSPHSAVREVDEPEDDDADEPEVAEPGEYQRAASVTEVSRIMLTPDLPDDEEAGEATGEPIVGFEANVDLERLRLGRQRRDRAEVLRYLASQYARSLKDDANLTGVDILVVATGDRSLGMCFWLGEPPAPGSAIRLRIDPPVRNIDTRSPR